MQRSIESRIFPENWPMITVFISFKVMSILIFSDIMQKLKQCTDWDELSKQSYFVKKPNSLTSAWSVSMLCFLSGWFDACSLLNYSHFICLFYFQNWLSPPSELYFFGFHFIILLNVTIKVFLVLKNPRNLPIIKHIVDLQQIFFCYFSFCFCWNYCGYVEQ